MDQGTLDCIYAAAADDEALNKALRETARACRARSAGLFRIVDGHVDWERSIDMPPEFMDDYVREIGADDPRTHLLQRYPVQTVLSDAHPAVRKAMRNQGVERFVTDYDLPYTAGAHLARSNRQLWNLYICHGRRQGPPEDNELAVFEQLVPHFSRCLALRLAHKTLHQRLHDDPEDPRTIGRVVRDAKGRVRWMDAGADAICARTGLFRMEGGSLSCRVQQGRSWLERAAAVTRSRQFHGRMPLPLTMMLRHPCGRMTLRLLPAGKPLDLDNIVTETTSDRHVIVMDWLPRSARGQPAAGVELTPRQWEVLSLLALGYDTSQVADQLDCARSTARNHSQALLARFRANSRIEMLERARRLGMIN